jgi:3'(2'), 5'-bisphosphate nucleotidase
VDDLLKLATRSAIAGSKAILNTPHSSVQRKKDDSPVTAADINSHHAIVEVLQSTKIPIVSEEGSIIRPDAGPYWLVDPLDGTREYIKGREHYTVNVNLMEDDIPTLGVIAIPEKSTVYFGDGSSSWMTSFNLEENTKLTRQDPEEFTVAVSQSHLRGRTLSFAEEMVPDGQQIQTIRAGSAVKFCMLLDGRATVYPRFAPCMEWDIAAGHVLLKGIGRNIIDLSTGFEMLYGKPEWLNGPFVAR